MSEVGEKIVEKVAEQAITKLSPVERLKAFMKNVIKYLIIIRWLISFFVVWFDNVRRAVVMSAMDKYPENKVWKTILWIKTWRWIYGIILGWITAYLYSVDKTFIETCKSAYNFLIELLEWIY